MRTSVLKSSNILSYESPSSYCKKANSSVIYHLEVTCWKKVRGIIHSCPYITQPPGLQDIIVFQASYL